MKRPLSLLEVAIGLALTALLLTALFSSFRQLMKTGIQVETARTEMHGNHLLQLRLNQIFESLTNGKLFYTDAHPKAHGDALYFTLNNGIDHDPEFSKEIDGVLYASNEKKSNLCLLFKDERLEIFVNDISDFSFNFFDLEEKKWVPTWKKKTLPPMVQIEFNGKTNSYTLPKANREVRYE